MMIDFLKRFITILLALVIVVLIFAAIIIMAEVLFVGIGLVMTLVTGGVVTWTLKNILIAIFFLPSIALIIAIFAED